MKHIGYEDAVLLLKEIVADRGEDWVYPDFNECQACSYLRKTNGEDRYCAWHMSEGCRYFTEQGAPACIVGEFIYRTLDRNEYGHLALEGEHAATVFSYLEKVITLDRSVEDMLITAQQQQDSGAPWGIALEQAIAVASRNRD